MNKPATPRVFVPMVPSRWDTTLGMWVPTVNITPAERHGELVVLLPPDANRLHTAPLVAALKERMRDYSENDSLVALGDPSLLAAAACIAARQTGGKLRMLKWDRRTADYIVTEIVL